MGCRATSGKVPSECVAYVRMRIYVLPYIYIYMYMFLGGEFGRLALCSAPRLNQNGHAWPTGVLLEGSKIHYL